MESGEKGAACIIKKNAKLIKESNKAIEENCYVIEDGIHSYATIKEININHGVIVYLVGIVDYNEDENKCYFDDAKNNYAVIKMSSRNRDDPEREARIYQLLHHDEPHPFIVQLLSGCLQCTNTGEKLIILEYMDMDLLQYAEYRKHSWFSQREIRLIFKQILSGLSHMHRKHVAHRDLGLENICIKNSKSDNYPVKLMDFGNSFLCDNGVCKKPTSVIRIKPCYDAPELSDANIQFYYPDKADVWSLGVILFILLVGRYPWKDAPRSQDIITELLNDIKINNEIEDDILDLLRCMLNIDPHMRMNTQIIAEHKWLGS